MGCDIHMYVELRGKDYCWYGLEVPNPYPTHPILSLTGAYTSRDYYLFTKLADVRSDDDTPYQPIDGSRGIPEDVSSVVYEEYLRMDSDGHSHSYFTLEELEKEDWRDFPEFEETIESLRDRAIYGPENIRIVFWFDN